eukprot:3581247-Pleurochrysis_carterae.AAC.1
MAIGGSSDVQPFDNYQVGFRFTASSAGLRRQAALRAFVTALPLTRAKELLPHSPRALFACFSIYAPWSRRVDRRRAHTDSVPAPIQPTYTQPPTLPPAWPDASLVDLH